MNKVRVRYGRVENRVPKNTLVTIKEGDLVYFGIARCNNEFDLFKKDIGKLIATKRAELAKIEPVPRHKSGLRGCVNADNVKKLLDYFQNIDNIAYETAVASRG